MKPPANSRREALKALGLVSLGTTLGGVAFGKPVDQTFHLAPAEPIAPKLNKTVKAIVVGAGNRGNRW